VERAGLGSISESQKLSYDVEQGNDGKSSAVNLKAA
jgi:CspA family cold shock protein